MVISTTTTEPVFLLTLDLNAASAPRLPWPQLRSFPARVGVRGEHLEPRHSFKLSEGSIDQARQVLSEVSEHDEALLELGDGARLTLTIHSEGSVEIDAAPLLVAASQLNVTIACQLVSEPAKGDVSELEASLAGEVAWRGDLSESFALEKVKADALSLRLASSSGQVGFEINCDQIRVFSRIAEHHWVLG